MSFGDLGHLTGIKIEHEDAVDEEGTGSYNDEWEISRLNYMGGGNKRARKNINEDI